MSKQLNNTSIIENLSKPINNIIHDEINTDKLVIHSAEAIHFNQNDLIIEECKDFPKFEVNEITPNYKDIEEQTLQESLKTNNIIINSAEAISLNHTKEIVEECQDFPAFGVNAIMSKDIKKPIISKIKHKIKQIIEENIPINSSVEVIPSKNFKLPQISQADQKYKIASAIQNLKFLNQTKNYKKFKNSKESKSFRKINPTYTLVDFNFNKYPFWYNKGNTYYCKVNDRRKDQNQSNQIFNLNRVNNWKKRRKLK